MASDWDKVLDQFTREHLAVWDRYWAKERPLRDAWLTQTMSQAEFEAAMAELNRERDAQIKRALADFDAGYLRTTIPAGRA